MGGGLVTLRKFISSSLSVSEMTFWKFTEIFLSIDALLNGKKTSCA